MKIIISSGNHFCKKYRIEIDKYKTVNQIRSLIPDSWKDKIGNDFQFFYEKFILNDVKMITFYKLKENDEIKIGKLEQFLNNDDVIVELFIAGWNATFIHLIVKRNDLIFKIKSILFRVIPKIFSIWNVNGIEMKNNQFVYEIDLIGGYYKLIISDKSDNNAKLLLVNWADLIGGYGLMISYKFDDNASQLLVNWTDLIGRYGLIIGDKYDDISNKKFVDCCKIHDQYLWWYHGMKSLISIGMFLSVFNIFFKSQLEERIRKLQSLLSMNDLIAPRLNEDLSTFPLSFVNSKFIFCNSIVNRIIDICNEYWQIMIDEYFSKFKRTMQELFRTCLYSVLLRYGKYRESTGYLINKTMRSIVVDALENFIKILNNNNNSKFYVLKCFHAFALQDYSKFNSDEIMKDKLLKEICFLKLKINKVNMEFYISQNSIKTTNQLKKSISMQTNIPIQQIYLIHDLGAEQSNVDGILHGTWLYSVEIMSDTKNIEELKLLGYGAFGTVHLCQDRITHEKFVVKKPVKSSVNLCRDISIQHLFPLSSKLSRYSALFYNKKEIFVAMDYFSVGSLSSYIKKVGKLSENVVMKISSQVLIQIYEMHKRGIMHRDIKCENVVLDEHMNAKLIDFGASKFTMFFPSGEQLTKRQLYTPGTMFYMAPELINSKPYSDKIDIWSFGMMLVEMVTGNRPFYGFTLFQAIIKLHKGVKVEYECSQPISEELQLFIDSCLNKDPNERPNARQLLTSEFFRNYFNETKDSQMFSYTFQDFVQSISKMVNQQNVDQEVENFHHMFSTIIEDEINKNSFQPQISNFFTKFKNFPFGQNQKIERESEQFFANNATNIKNSDDNNSQFDMQNAFSDLFKNFFEILFSK